MHDMITVNGNTWVAGGTPDGVGDIYLSAAKIKTLIIAYEAYSRSFDSDNKNSMRVWGLTIYQNREFYQAISFNINSVLDFMSKQYGVEARSLNGPVACRSGTVSECLDFIGISDLSQMREDDGFYYLDSEKDGIETTYTLHPYIA